MMHFEVNDSAVKVLGDDTLKIIAKEIADKVRKNATIDWTIRESARAKLMVLVKRTLSNTVIHQINNKKQLIRFLNKQNYLRI